MDVALERGLGIISRFVDRCHFLLSCPVPNGRAPTVVSDVRYCRQLYSTIELSPLNPSPSAEARRSHLSATSPLTSFLAEGTIAITTILPLLAEVHLGLSEIWRNCEGYVCVS